MHDIASQLVLKWARQGPQQRIVATNDFTRLTLDTIALCSMDFRFNSFYQDEMHPFVQAMNTTLGAANNAGQLSGIITRLMPSYQDNVEKSKVFMYQTSMELVQYRRDHPSEKKDLLNALIYGKDPKTGKTMRDDLIAANMSTFLVAGELCYPPHYPFAVRQYSSHHPPGHETTSGLLSFALLQLLKNPKTYFAAQSEVDRVLGRHGAKLTARHLNELKYLHAVLRETLRLTPTAPAFSRAVRPENTEETVYIGGKQPGPDGTRKKYAIPRGQSVACLLSKIHTDPTVWGPDAHEFRPERMRDEAMATLPKNAWKPFGTGMRGCIGRAFAWQEAVLVLALVLQTFDVRLEDPSYEMRIQQSLTVKPKDFFIRASLREGITPTVLVQTLSGEHATQGVHQGGQDEGALNGESSSSGGGVVDPHGAAHLTILYGSNTGTCQALAQKLSAQCQQKGLTADVRTLDIAMGTVPKERPTIFITASYEGLPTDDAARFVAWLESLKDEGAHTKLAGVQFAVFGCGHSDWRSTFQRIPQLVDGLLPELGAERLVERGVSDVSKQSTFDDFEAWTSGHLWPALEASASLLSSTSAPAKESAVPTIELDWTLAPQERAGHLQQNVQWASVVDTKRLTAPDEPEKRHVEIALPAHMSYTAGDYLAILPLNPKAYVRRVMTHFQLVPDAVVTIKPGSATSLPTGTPLGVFDLLQGYVEISQPATKRDLEVLVALCTDQSVRQHLADYLEPATFAAEVVSKRMTVLDILREHKEALPVPFGTYLSLLPPMRTRHYSISSSPLASPTTATITYSVLDAPAWYQPSKEDPKKHRPAQRFLGVATNYLCALSPGDPVLVSVRATNPYFHLPADQEHTPIVMLANGSGLAPFRGFVQERATLLLREGEGTPRRDAPLAPALLLAGCRRRGRDQLYAEEFAEWARLGAVDVRWVFSQEEEEENGDNDDDGVRYVQDLFLRDFEQDILPLWETDARFYICGSRGLAKGVGDAAKRIAKGGAERRGESMTEEEAGHFVEKLRNERFVTDIF